MWARGGSGSGLTGKESQKNVLGGNRGLFPNAWPHADVSRYKSREEQAARRKILGRFRFLGRLLGAALCDGFVAPIPIATEFFELLLGEKPDFVTAASLIEGEAGFISGLATVSSSLRSIRQKAAVQGTDSTKDEEELMNLTDDALVKRFATVLHKANSKWQTIIFIIKLGFPMDLRFEDPTQCLHFGGN